MVTQLREMLLLNRARKSRPVPAQNLLRFTSQLLRRLRVKLCPLPLSWLPKFALSHDPEAGLSSPDGRPRLYHLTQMWSAMKVKERPATLVVG